MKKVITRTFVFAALLVSMTSVGLSAQTKDYRSPGYKGSIGLTDQFVVHIGLETSHGVMLNRTHYLGVGAGAFVTAVEEHPVFGNVFVDYQAYLRDSRSTPVLGLKAGYAHAFNFEDVSGVNFNNAVLVEPGVAWSWGLKSGNGLTLGLGAPAYILVSEKRTSKNILFMPKLSFSFEF